MFVGRLEPEHESGVVGNFIAEGERLRRKADVKYRHNRTLSQRISDQVRLASRAHSTTGSRPVGFQTLRSPSKVRPKSLPY